MIASLNLTSALSATLKASGLSQDKVQRVEADVKQVQTAAVAARAKSIDAKAVRAAIDQKIAEDVASGKLSKEDAAKIGKALDEMEAKVAAKTAAAAKSGSTSSGDGDGVEAGGGGGGVSATEKTELSRVVTASGGMTTTVITYTDGTTETKVSVASDPSKVKSASGDTAEKEQAEKTDAASSGAETTVRAYLATIEAGTLFEGYA